MRMGAPTVNRLGLGAGISLLVILGYLGVCGGGHVQKWMINFALVIFGVGLGILVGFLASPYEGDEKKRFPVYAKYLLVAVSGYLASKLDKGIDSAISASATQPEVALQVIIFLGSVVMSIVIAFVARRYPL
jgi:hypothetical protein